MRRASLITTGGGLKPLYYGRLLNYFNKYLLSSSELLPSHLVIWCDFNFPYQYSIMTGLISSKGFYALHALVGMINCLSMKCSE